MGLFETAAVALLGLVFAVLVLVALAAAFVVRLPAEWARIAVRAAGSSSLKFQVIATDMDRIEKRQDQRLCRGEVERAGGEAIITFQAKDNPKQKFTAALRDIPACLDYLVRYIASDQSGVTEIRNTADIQAVGHRVVHGGELFSQSALIDE